MDYSRPQLADALAAQYVAGTLRGGSRARFENLLPSHPALQQAVHDWRNRLMPLTDAVAPQSPPANVWAAIESRLWPAQATAAKAATSAPASAGSPLPWLQRLGLWRGFSAVALAAVVGLAVLVATPPPAQAPVVVVLQSTGAALGGAPGGGPGGGTGAGTAALTPASTIIASLSGDGRALVTRTLTPVGITPDRALELWSVPPEGAPRSLGLISADGATVLQRGKLPATLLKGGTAALAVSVEPPGGSPTGAPTGPVVFAGKLQI